ncbi:hypothetical protein ACQKOH_03695 [Sphingomonas sp. NPDC092331]|jgi:hypothetical protein|uniref:hypothetical protein n=1 Tax=unclassified Sphingomonas TaxID=196159 RepID=UPI0031F4B84A
MRETVEDTISIDSQVELPEQFDIAAYAAARAFNNSAYPPGMPDWVQAAIEARAVDICEAAKDNLALDELSEPGAKEKRRKEAGETTEAQFGFIIQQQQREREEWLKSSVTVAGTTMTGAEWQDLSKRLREDDDFRDKLMQLFIARGMSRDEAEARVERVAEVAEIAAIPESQRTDEQKRYFSNAQADPTFKKDAEGAQTLLKPVAPQPRSELHGSFKAAASGEIAETPAVSQLPATQNTVDLQNFAI